jgi:hypothetical protein
VNRQLVACVCCVRVFASSCSVRAFACGACVVCEIVRSVSFVLVIEDINLVDPASSHTLVSKIKPCMSKYKQFCTVKLRMAHYISYSLLDSTLLLG